MLSLQDTEHAWPVLCGVGVGEPGTGGVASQEQLLGRTFQSLELPICVSHPPGHVTLTFQADPVGGSLSHAVLGNRASLLWGHES